MTPVEQPDPTAGINTTCQQCELDCEIWQEVRTSYLSPQTEIWCYCPMCDIETFHPLPSLPPDRTAPS